MENLRSHHIHLENLQHQMRRLTATGVSLITLLTEEANRLSREDEVSRLKALYRVVVNQSQQVESSENSARGRHIKRGLSFSVAGLFANIAATEISKSKPVSLVLRHLFDSPGDEQRPFGRVLVCIGPEGLPDDAGVVSISQLAREANREESGIINKLREHGYLLLGEKAFSLLIDRLVADVREGRLRLPVSREKLAEITASGEPKPEAKN